MVAKSTAYETLCDCRSQYRGNQDEATDKVEGGHQPSTVTFTNKLESAALLKTIKMMLSMPEEVADKLKFDRAPKHLWGYQDSSESVHETVGDVRLASLGMHHSSCRVSPSHREIL